MIRPFGISYKTSALLCFIVCCIFSCQSSTDNTQYSVAKVKGDYATGEMAIQHGLELFNQHCASCHGFYEDGIGPNLTGVTLEVDKDWLIKFIHNPAEAIDSGDPRAVSLYEKYNQYMPSFAMITGEEMEHILGFMHKFSEGEKRNTSNRTGGLINPIPAKIPTSDLVLMLEEQFVVPASSEAPPKTRINKMHDVPGGRLFLHDLRGKLYEVKGNDQLTLYLDLASELPDFMDNPGKGSGFGSWAFHPDFEHNGLFYTTHTEPAGTKTADYPVHDSIEVTLQHVLLEWKAGDPAASLFKGSRREMLRVDMVGSAHTFQELIFNPLASKGDTDYGMLYLGIGDASTALRGYPYLCDGPEHIWGSVIRIDPSGNNSLNGAYGIPEDNPFVNTTDALGEIWVYGFRNPHRIAWDETGSGMMLISNIGQHSVEEVNIGQPGLNYGWPYREGTFLFDVNANPELVYPLPEEDEDFAYPVLQYDHDEGSAVSGGFVYSGAIPELKGKYIFGDISLGTLFYSDVDAFNQGQQAPIYRLRVAIDGELAPLETVVGEKRVELRLGKDQAGEIYIMAKANGGVYKVVGCHIGELPLKL